MKPRVKGAIAAVLILIGINILAKVYVESLWFQELNLLPVYWKRLGWQLGIAVLFGGLSWGFLSYQIRVARGLAEAATPQPSPPISDIRSRYLPDPLNASRRSPRSGALYLPVLLPLIVALQFTIAALGMYYLWVTVGVWTPDYTLPSITPAIPKPFHINWLFINFQEWRTQIAVVIVGILLTVFSAWRWRWSLPGFVALLSGVWGTTVSGKLVTVFIISQCPTL